MKGSEGDAPWQPRRRILRRGQAEAEDVNVNPAGEAVVMELDWGPMKNLGDAEDDAPVQRRILGRRQRRILRRRQADDVNVNLAGEAVLIANLEDAEEDATAHPSYILGQGSCRRRMWM